MNQSEAVDKAYSEIEKAGQDYFRFSVLVKPELKALEQSGYERGLEAGRKENEINKDDDRNVCRNLDHGKVDNCSCV